MALDLTLLPLLTDRMDPLCSHQIITLDRDYELFDKIRELPALTLPAPLNCHLAQNEDGEVIYGEVTTDPFGDPLTYTTAGDILSARDHMGDCSGWKTRAAFAYLAEMPKHWPIVLWWN